MRSEKPRGTVIRTVLVIVVLLLAAAFFAAAAMTKMLPWRFLAVLAALLLMLTVVVALLTRDRRRRGAFVAGVVLAVLFGAASLLGSAMIFRGVGVLREVTAAAEATPEPTAVPEVTATPEPTAEPTPEPTAEPTPEPVEYPDVFTVYISGIDSREGLVDKSYSDVNIFATVNRTTHQILLVTTPRDSYIHTAVSGDARDKLTHVGQLGIDALVETMQTLYDTHIDYWFRVNFGGFKNIVDAMGGVDVYSDFTFTAFDGHSFTEGWNTLDGSAALAFARERKTFYYGDQERGRHQMKLIDALLHKILSTDLLPNYNDLLDATEGCFETSIPYDLIAQLVRDQLEYGGDWTVIPYEVTGTEDYQVTYSYPDKGKLWVLWISDDAWYEAVDLIARVKAGEVVTLP